MKLKIDLFRWDSMKKNKPQILKEILFESYWATGRKLLFFFVCLDNWIKINFVKGQAHS